jgi:hypothetical protein
MAMMVQSGRLYKWLASAPFTGYLDLANPAGFPTADTCCRDTMKHLEAQYVRLTC